MAGFFIHRLFYVLPNPLNRITAATDNTRRFGLSNVKYDKNGNITHLTRGGHLKEMPDWDKDDDFGTMDQLDYQYFDGSNRLRSVTDGILKNDTSGKGEFVDGNKDGDDYVYDPNGNMTQDLNKGIKGTTSTEKGIEYNHLNLPTLVRVNNGADVGTISYIYDATGVKLRKNVLKQGETTPTATDYAGNYIYENGKLQFFSQPEGYVEPKNPDNLDQGYDYIYQYTDHLGNIRLSYKNVGTTTVDLEIQEENNYYPFGLEHEGYNNVVNGVENNYMTYNGKELDESLELNWHDYGERNYDASLGRFMNMDLYAHNYMKYSPYGYVLNNPISNVDYKGKFVLPKEFLIKYERLAQYLANDVQGVLENKKITNALKKFGGFNDAQLKEAFTWGQGPVVDIDQLDNLKSFGVTIGTGITIDVDLVDALEKAIGKDRDYLLFLTAVTLLHEFVHYGDNINGVTDADDVTTEQGNDFEIEVYGRVIKLGDTKELLDKYLEEQKKQEEESHKKEESFNNLINNLDSLESGKYEWNGEDFVKTD